MGQILRRAYCAINQFLKSQFLLLFCLLFLNLNDNCLAEYAIKEVGHDFHLLPTDVGSSSYKDHDSAIACYVLLPYATVKNRGEYDATDARYNFDGTLCTHLVLSFLYITNKFEIIEDDDTDEIAKFQSIKQKYRHLKVLLEVRIKGTNKEELLQNLVFYNRERQNFIIYMNTFLRKLYLDGILLNSDIYSNAPKRFNILIQEMKDTFQKNGLLIAVEINLEVKEKLKNYENIAQISRIFDFVFVDASGFNIPNEVMILARYRSPLYSKEINDENVFDNLKTLVSEWNGNPRNLILAITVGGRALVLNNSTDDFPFGYNSTIDTTATIKIKSPWQQSFVWSYTEICSNVTENNDIWKMYWDNTARVPFLKKESLWITFENSKSIAEKTAFINDLGLRGISMWALNYDDPLGYCSNVTYPLLKTINHVFSKNKSKRRSKLCSLFAADNNSVIQHEPVLSLSNYDLTVVNGDSAQVNCTADGSRPFELTWMKETAEYATLVTKSDKNIEITTVELKNNCRMQMLTSNLKIKRVLSNENYKCQVSYSNGNKYKHIAFKIQVAAAANMESKKAIVGMGHSSGISSSVTIWLTATLFPLTLFGIAILSFALIVRRKKIITELTKREIAEFRNGTINWKNACGEEQCPENEPYDESRELLKNEYKIDKTQILGIGTFGVVFSGQVKNTDVAVKTTKPGADKQYLKALLSELKILAYIEHHPHIVNLLGAVTTELEKGNLYVFVELCPLGNLQDFLRKSRDTFTNNGEEGSGEDVITSAHLFMWSFQIVKGLLHLSSKKVIHGDLATRNVLLFDKDTIKITDFGLSRKLYENPTYAKKSDEPLPWGWMAIESLRDRTFSIQSDVWSFGVTLWEIFSLAQTPYPGISWSCDFVDKLEQGLRLQKPMHAPDSLYNILLECWKCNPMERPTPQKNLESFSTLMIEQMKDVYLLVNEEKTPIVSPEIFGEP